MRILWNAFTLGLIVLCHLFQGAPLGAQTNPVPFINNPLVPSVAVQGGAAFTVTVNGAGFAPGAVVNWNHSARATTFISPTQLTAVILASDIAAARSVRITVLNPAPGGGISNADFFIVAAPAVPESNSGLHGASMDARSFPAAAAATTLAFNRADVGSGDLAQPSGMVEGDFGGPGNSFLAVANGRCPASRGCVLEHADIAIFGAAGGGAFSVPFTGASPRLITSGDFNGDGFLDLITLGSSAVPATGPSYSLLLGSGNGTFQIHVDRPVPGGIGPVAVATGDFNHDGHLDLAITESSNISILLGNGDGTFGLPMPNNIGMSPGDVAVADFNGDGKLDLAVADSISGMVSVLLGNGDGTFQTAVDYAAGTSPAVIVVADFNGDGKPDLAVTNGNSKVSILLGKGDGTFQPKVDYPGGITTTYLAVGDYNGDGILDLVVSDALCSNATCPPNGSANILLGNGDGTFQSHLDFQTGAFPSTIVSLGQGFATLNVSNDTVSIFTPASTSGGNPVPTLSSIAPLSVQVGSGAFTLTITGTNFISGATVIFGATAVPTTVVSSTQITAAISANEAAIAGTVGVSVLNPTPGGGSSTSLIFNVFLPPPAISSLNPPSVVAGGPAFTLTINGSNFVNGASVKIVGGASLPTTFVSSTQLNVTVDATLIANQGSLSIAVTDPLGAGSPGGTVAANLPILPTNTQPVIGALVPASTTAGSPAFTLKISGVGFTANSIVTFNSSAVSAAFTNSTLLQAAIPAGAIAVAGTPFVTVTNPGGSPSLITTFTVNNPVPTASSLTPTTVAAGSVALTLGVSGANFNPSSRVLVNGAVRSTTFSNTTSLSATLPASDFAQPGSLNVTVSNPAPGGGITAALTFVVTDFNVTVPVPTNSVIAGTPANFNVTVTPINSSTANPVTFAVSGLPRGATATFAPPNLPAGSKATPVTLTITTVAHSTAVPGEFPQTIPPYCLAICLFGMAVATCLAMYARSKRTLPSVRVATRLAQQIARPFAVASLLVIVAGLVACGGGVPGPAAPAVNSGTGTPAGTYPIVVTATSGGGSLSTMISLTVQ